MRRKITVFIIIGVCYLLQTTFFDTLSFASISPNLLIIVTSSFGFMRGRKEGLFIGFFCGLLLDIFGGGVLGFYSIFSIKTLNTVPCSSKILIWFNFFYA